MRRLSRLLIVLIVAASILSWSAAQSQPDRTAEDRTLSPYFLVKSDDPTVDRLPLKATLAAVNISGVIADVQVTQRYRNEGKKPLEAIYVFPASTRAAVYGMKMTIGKRVIEARIKKRDEARREYEQARDEGRSASLLEQQRPNVFQMNVANILPGDEITVELKYTELLVPEDRVYEFVYPTVVGPRYSNAQADQAPPSEQWSANPYLHSGEAPPYAFDISVNLATGLPLRDISSPSHSVKTTFSGPAQARVLLDPSEKSGGNRDYLLRYRLDGDKVQSGLLLYAGEKENFFLLMMQPPRRIAPDAIPGREYIFIVDVSGSMHGYPLDISKKLLANLIGGLRPSDRFNVLLFSGGSSLMSEESLPATPENVQRAIAVIENQRGGGGTEILPALQRALALKKREKDSRTVVIVTDGYVTVEEEVFDLIRNNLGKANLFAFGIGTSVNRHLIEGMARVGMGEPQIIEKRKAADAKAERFRKMIASPVLTQVKVDFDGFTAYDVEPVSLPDVMAERPVILFGKWRGKPAGTVTLKGISGKGPYSETLSVGKVSPLPGNTALRYLWARHRIALLSDYNRLRPKDERIEEVTKLGLTYNLLTAYTSFVAVDSEIRADGRLTTVKQPLPLPEGVSDYAVGGPIARSMMTSAPLAVQAREESGRPAYDSSPRNGAKKEKYQGNKTGAGAASLAVEAIVVSGGISKGDVEKLVKNQLSFLEPCFAGSLFHVKHVLILTLSPDGTVREVTDSSGTLNNVPLKSCVFEHLKKWRFPATKDGRAASVTLTLTMGR
ncbi:MAG: Vault protein inter-alpha-trypsin [Syntrophus sp. PtaU1.Bin208]|nr:MAG: Vault protein inter-alpha-trypsin [Syntrophus sp. PtaU1.Bin208]